MKKIIIFIYILSSSGCAYLNYVKDPFVDIPNFYKVDERIYRGGQPKEKGYATLKSLGVKTVLSLRGEGNVTLKEKERLNALGINFFHIPMSKYKRPTDEDVLNFLDIVLDKNNQPVFAHCSSGRDRTGAMIAMYKIVALNWTIKNAYKEAKSLGFWPYYGEEPALHDFIHQLKDKPIYFEKARNKINTPQENLLK